MTIIQALLFSWHEKAIPIIYGLCSLLPQSWGGKNIASLSQLFVESCHSKLAPTCNFRLSQETLMLWGEFVTLGPTKKLTQTFTVKDPKTSLQAYWRSSASVSTSVLCSPVTTASSSFSSWISFCRRIIIYKWQGGRINVNSSLKGTWWQRT